MSIETENYIKDIYRKIFKWGFLGYEYQELYMFRVQAYFDDLK
jgi:hypothetical protein